jgi:hypothetical protein
MFTKVLIAAKVFLVDVIIIVLRKVSCGVDAELTMSSSKLQKWFFLPETKKFEER